MILHTIRRWTLVAPLVVCLLAATTAWPAQRDTAAPSTQASFAQIIRDFSEEGGYFDTDNLISNEKSYLHVITQLEQSGVKGGVYIGVGPDQNFSYIARIRPNMA